MRACYYGHFLFHFSLSTYAIQFAWWYWHGRATVGVIDGAVQLAGLLGLTIFPILRSHLQPWLSYRWIYSLTFICGIAASTLAFTACLVLGTPFAPVILFAAAALASPIHDVGLRALGDNVPDYDAVERAHSLYGLAGTAAACLIAIAQATQDLPASVLILPIAFASLFKQSAVSVTRWCEAQIRANFVVRRNGICLPSVGIAIVLGDAIFWIAHLVSAIAIIDPSLSSHRYSATILLLPLIAYCGFLRAGVWLWARVVMPTAVLVGALFYLASVRFELFNAMNVVEPITFAILLIRGITIDAFNSELRDFRVNKANLNFIDVALTLVPFFSLWLGIIIIISFSWFIIIGGVWLLAAGLIVVRTSASFVPASEFVHRLAIRKAPKLTGNSPHDVC